LGSDVSCVKRCVASSAGSPKRLSEECDPDTVRGAGGSSGPRRRLGFPGVMALIVVALSVFAGGAGYYAYSSRGGAEAFGALRGALAWGSGRGFRRYDRFEGERFDDFAAADFDTP
jgi:hypothetical protein